MIKTFVGDENELNEQLQQLNLLDELPQEVTDEPEVEEPTIKIEDMEISPPKKKGRKKAKPENIIIRAGDDVRAGEKVAKAEERERSVSYISEQTRLEMEAGRRAISRLNRRAE